MQDLDTHRLPRTQTPLPRQIHKDLALSGAHQKKKKKKKLQEKQLNHVLQVQQSRGLELVYLKNGFTGFPDPPPINKRAP